MRRTGRAFISMEPLTDEQRDMVEKHLGLIQKFVTRVQCTLEPAELFQIGSFGLMRAVQLFKPEMGLKFSTYAGWWIRAAINRELYSGQYTIRVPEYMMVRYFRVKRFIEAYRVEHGRKPTDDEICKAIVVEGKPMSKASLKSMRKNIPGFVFPIHEPRFGKEENPSWEELIADDLPNPAEVAELDDRKRELKKSISGLRPFGKHKDMPPDRNRQILRRRFWNEETLQEIGDDLGLSRERIRQIEHQAIEELREAMS